MRDLRYPIALCQATGLTRRYGWTMAVGKEDQCCIGGARAMGFEAGGVGGPVGERDAAGAGKVQVPSHRAP